MAVAYSDVQISSPDMTSRHIFMTLWKNQSLARAGCAPFRICNHRDPTMTNLIFTKFLGEYRNGDLEASLSEHLDAIGASLRDFEGGASLTLKLNFKRDKHGAISIVSKVDAKLPKPELRPALFYLTQDGGFSRRDPAQTDIEDVPGVRRSLVAVAGQ